MNAMLIIIQKELVDNLRDYRSWVTGLFWAIFGPLLLGVLLMLVGNTIHASIDKPLHLPVSGAENAPNLVNFIKRQNVIIDPAPANPRTAVIAGDLNVVLVIPAAYAADFSTGKTATIQLVLDSSRQSAAPDIQRILEIIKGYDNYTASLRLSVRGISPQVLDVISIEQDDTSTPQSQALIFIAMLPYFIIFAIFNGASPVITDATAGERERGSLEPLLINPVARGTVAVAKLLSAAPFAIINLVVILFGFAAIFQFLPLDQIIGVPLSLDAMALFYIFLVCLPIVFLACAIQTLIASFARTSKEAGTYLPFIGLIPSLPGLALAFLPVKPDLWAMLIPTFGQQILINQFLRSEPIRASNLAISAIVTLITAVIITLAAIRLYRSERIIGA